MVEGLKWLVIGMAAEEGVSDLSSCVLCEQQWGSADTDTWTWTCENDQDTGYMTQTNDRLWLQTIITLLYCLTY